MRCEFGAILVLFFALSCYAKHQEAAEQFRYRSRRSSGLDSVVKTYVSQNDMPTLYRFANIHPGLIVKGRKVADGIPIPPQTIRLRGELSDMNPNEGRVEVFYRGQYGLIADDFWNKPDADVACKQLGFVKGAKSFPRFSEYGVPRYMRNTDITMSALRCEGSEKALQACSHENFPVISRNRTAGLVCTYNDGCPYGWSAFNNMCYRVVSTKKTFQDAQQHCAGLGANLVYLQSTAENNFVSDMLHLKFQNVLSAWTAGLWAEFGAARRPGWTYGAWIWNGTARLMGEEASKLWFPGFYTWNSGIRPEASFRRKSCAALTRIFKDAYRRKYADVGYFWLENLTCKQRLPFICQRPSSGTTSRQVGTDCVTGDGSSYRGTRARTEFGTPCEKWNSFFSVVNPQTHPYKGLGNHNFCRNPDGDSRPWCWVDARLQLYGYCRIAQCSVAPTPAPTEATTYRPPKPGFGQGRCRSNQFLCTSMLGYRNECIQKSEVCDGRRNCDGGEDESENFCRSYLCNAAEFFCAKDALCVARSRLCDGIPDCSDSSDERNCTIAASILDRFRGTPRKTISTTSNVNGYGYLNSTLKKCAEYCLRSSRVGFTCQSFFFQRKQPNNVCFIYNKNSGSAPVVDMPGGALYEFVRDCGGGSDVFRCKNSRCLTNQTSRCNGVDDCGDNSDESGCNTGTLLPFKVRLAGSNNAYEGRVEVRYNGEWGLVCDDNFGANDATVICKELGFPGASAYHHNARDVFGGGNGIFLMDEVACTGSEKSLASCPHNGWSNHDCIAREVAAVTCTVDRACTDNEFRCDSVAQCVHIKNVCDGKRDCRDGSDERDCSIRVKLIGGPSEKHGVVRIRRNSIEGTICDDEFDDKDAQVICRMLGYTGRARVSQRRLGPGPGVIWLDDLMCRGTESSVAACPGVTWGQSDCTHEEDVAVECNVREESTTTATTLTPTRITTPQPPITVPVLPTTPKPRTCGTAPLMRSSSGRIFGGVEAYPGAFPWQVGIKKRVSDGWAGHWCGGSVISDKWVLSAAHCFSDNLRKDIYELHFGDFNNQRDESHDVKYDIDDIIVHPDYNKGESYSNDVALLKIRPKNGQTLRYTPHIQPICLPDAQTPGVTGQRCFISGWGKVSYSNLPTKLQYAQVPIMERVSCKNMYKNQINDGMVCAGFQMGGIDTCQGDSGGPLACKDQGRFVLMGATSWGNGCGEPNNPGVYAYIPKYTRWIKNIMSRP